MSRRIELAGLLATLLLSAGCGLFGLGDIPCESDENCPDGMHCGDEALCRDGSGLPGHDAAGHDAGVGSDATSTGNDSGSSGDDAGSTGSDSGGSGNDATSTVDATSTADATSTDLLRPMPDSPTSYCQAEQLGSGTFCPAEGSSAYGQDGSYRIWPPSYRLESNVVIDATTGLSWQRDSSASTLSWAEAVSYCEGSSLGDHQDWRLPNYLELAGLLDLGHSDGPAVELVAFNGTQAEDHWSSTLNSYNASTGRKRMIVPFDGFFSPPHFRAEDDRLYAKCVRGEEQRSGPLVAGLTTVHDPRSGLSWEVQEHAQAESWVEALRICTALSLDGHDDWRLPSVKEWITVFDHTRGEGPSVDPALVVDGTWQWTSSAFIRGSGVWVVDVDHGMPNGSNSLSNTRFRCVRGGVDQGWD